MYKNTISIFSLLVILLVACGKKEETKKTEPINIDSIKVNQVVGIASVEPQQRVMPLTCEVSGLVAKILKNSGDAVNADDVILELEHTVESAQLVQAQSKLATQESVISAQKANKASVEVKFNNAKNTFERNQRLLTSGAITQQVFDDSKASMEGLQKDLLTNDANIAQQQSKLKELQADVAYYKTLLNRKIVTAPVKGVILNLIPKLGSVINSNESFGDFAPEGPYMAIGEIDEMFAQKLALGQSAFIREQGALDTLATGKVFFISPYLKKKSLFSDRPDNMEDRRVREVRVLLDDKTKVLIGTRVECVIGIGK
jgi:HlyD family secretion protein